MLASTCSQGTSPLLVTIRPIDLRDETRWRVLWDGYTRFYEREPREEVTHFLWQRLHNPASVVKAIVAVDKEDRAIGIAHYLTHESTSAMWPVCYLQDLFVDPETRAKGVGKALIDWLLTEVRRQGWSRLYWSTRETNYRARGLYDKYTPHSGFLRYVIDNPDT